MRTRRTTKRCKATHPTTPTPCAKVTISQSITPRASLRQEIGKAYALRDRLLQHSNSDEATSSKKVKSATQASLIEVNKNIHKLLKQKTTRATAHEVIIVCCPTHSFTVCFNFQVLSHKQTFLFSALNRSLTRML